MPNLIVEVCDDIPPSELADFLLWVERLKDKIPEEYHHTARVVISAEMHYEQEFPTCVVSYTRPETKEETERRKKQEHRDRTSRELYERAQYEALKAKFESLN